MEVNRDGVQAEGLDRLLDRDMAAFNLVPGGGQRFGDIARRHRAVELPGLAGLAYNDHLDAVELGRHLVRAALEFGVARLEIGASDLEFLLVGLCRAQRLAARQKEIARVAVLHAHGLADVSELAYTLHQNDVHDLSPSLSSRGRGSNESRARAQLEESIDDAEGRKNGKGVFGPQNAAGIERNQHEGPHLETARQRVRDREALQRQRCSEPTDADGEILRRRNRQGVSACETSKECDAYLPGKRKRG